MNPRPLLVIGGRQRAPRGLRDRSGEWYGYESGVILRVDSEGISTLLEYTSPAGSHEPGDAVLFKAATRSGDHLYCCTQTEVIVYRMSPVALEQVAYISLPIFNDVHHVAPTRHGTLLVAVSGLELVVEITLDGEIVGEWDMLGEDTWERHPRDVDYRIGVNLKPHRAHPNHVSLVGDEPWITRFELRDAVSLCDPTRIIAPGGERLHDGVFFDGLLWFTSVDGEVIAADPVSTEVVSRHRLEPMHDEDASLGWCRGLHFDGAGHVWVGFSRIRFTHLRQTVSWVRHRGVPRAPTRIARYRLSDWRCDAEVVLEPYGLNAVFSVVPAMTEGAAP